MIFCQCNHQLAALTVSGIRNYLNRMSELWESCFWNSPGNWNHVDSKIHFVIKPNFCQHNAGRYILDKMWTVFVAYIAINNDSELFRASKTFVNTSVDSENCSSRNRHENTFLSQTEQNEFLSTHSAWYILDKK